MRPPAALEFPLRAGRAFRISLPQRTESETATMPIGFLLSVLLLSPPTVAGPLQEKAGVFQFAKHEFEVDFTGTPREGCVTQWAYFKSRVRGGTATTYHWDFGNGATSDEPHPAITYPQAGSYTVTLTVTGPDGSVVVTKEDYITVAPSFHPVQLDFTAHPTQGPLPLAVNFESYLPPVTGSHLWDFGDGETSTELHPVHVYDEPGEYTVTLSMAGHSGSDVETRVGYIRAGTAPSTIVFNDVSDEVGLGGLYTIGNTHTGGSAWVDYNGDYLADLFVTNGGGYVHWLFRNEGDGTFADVSYLVPKPDIKLEDAGVKFADIDNDGDSDIFVPVDNAHFLIPNITQPGDGGPNLLYMNQGDGTFVEAAAGSGLVDPLGRRNIAAAFADYDLDGLVDAYVANWELMKLPLGLQDSYDRLLHNVGGGVFEDVTAEMGVDGDGLDALVVAWADLNLDRYPDLYVGNVAHAYCPPNFYIDDKFYRNDNGTFSDYAATSPGIGDDAPAAMGFDVGDIDNDGDWDVYITDIIEGHVTPLVNVLYKGNPDGTLSDNSADTAFVTADRSWPCNFADFDRDMWTDLWVGTSLTEDPDYMFVNRRDGTFGAVAVDGFEGYKSRGGSISDYDGDGDVDIFAWAHDGLSHLVRNDSTDTRNWLEVKLLGVQTNRDAIGAVVRVGAGGVTQMRRVSGGDSAHSQSDLIVHFGTGNNTAANVGVNWPSGVEQLFPAVPVNQLVVIDEVGGIVVEELSEVEVVFDAEQKALSVVSRSNYGGRTRLSVPGYGALRYVAERTRFEGRFEVPDGAPADLRIESSRGGSWAAPVPVLGRLSRSAD